MAPRDRDMTSVFRLSPAMLLYGTALLLLLFYITVWLASVLRNAAIIFSPRVRILLLLSVCLCAFLGARLPRRGESTDIAITQRRVRKAIWFCFALYLHLVLTFTLFDRAMGRDILYAFRATAENRAYYMRWHTNFTPLHSIRTVYLDGYRNGQLGLYTVLLNLGGNIAMFTPLGFFLPYLCPNMRHPVRYCAITLATILAVELCQLALMCGAFDVDDILLNFSGALLAYILLRLPPLKRLLARLLGESTM